MVARGTKFSQQLKRAEAQNNVQKVLSKMDALQVERIVAGIVRMQGVARGVLARRRIALDSESEYSDVSRSGSGSGMYSEYYTSDEEEPAVITPRNISTAAIFDQPKVAGGGIDINEMYPDDDEETKKKKMAAQVQASANNKKKSERLSMIRFPTRNEFKAVVIVQRWWRKSWWRRFKKKKDCKAKGKLVKAKHNDHLVIRTFRFMLEYRARQRVMLKNAAKLHRARLAWYGTCHGWVVRRAAGSVLQMHVRASISDLNKRIAEGRLKAEDLMALKEKRNAHVREYCDVIERKDKLYKNKVTGTIYLPRMGDVTVAAPRRAVESRGGSAGGRRAGGKLAAMYNDTKSSGVRGRASVATPPAKRSSAPTPPKRSSVPTPPKRSSAPTPPKADSRSIRERLGRPARTGPPKTKREVKREAKRTRATTPSKEYAGVESTLKSYIRSDRDRLNLKRDNNVRIFHEKRDYSAIKSKIDNGKTRKTRKQRREEKELLRQKRQEAKEARAAARLGKGKAGKGKAGKGKAGKGKARGRTGKQADESTDLRSESTDTSTFASDESSSDFSSVGSSSGFDSTDDDGFTDSDSDGGGRGGSRGGGSRGGGTPATISAGDRDDDSASSSDMSSSGDASDLGEKGEKQWGWERRKKSGPVDVLGEEDGEAMSKRKLATVTFDL